MKRTALNISASANKSKLKDRPIGSSYRPSSRPAQTTKYTQRVVENPGGGGGGQISCAGATTEVILLALIDPNISNVGDGETVVQSRILLEVNGREYDITESPTAIPSELGYELLDFSETTLTRPPNSPSAGSITRRALRIFNESTTEVKRIKITNMFYDNGVMPKSIMAASTDGNPTVGALSIGTDRITQTFCLARVVDEGGGGGDPEEPTDPEIPVSGDARPDFAFAINGSPSSKSINMYDSLDNDVSGPLTTTFISGMWQFPMLSHHPSESGVSYLNLDSETQNLFIGLGDNLTAGDSILVSAEILVDDSNPNNLLWSAVGNNYYYILTGEDLGSGEHKIYVPLHYILGEPLANRRYRFRATPYRDRPLGSKSLCYLNAPETMLETKSLYQMRHMEVVQGVASKVLWIEATDNGVRKTFRVPFNPDTVKTIDHPLPNADANNISGYYGTLARNNQRMWATVQSTTSSSITYRIYDSLKGTTQNVTLSTTSYVMGKSPKLLFSKDSTFLTFVYPNGSHGVVNLVTVGTMILDPTTFLYRALGSDTLDLTKTPVPIAQSVYTDSGSTSQTGRWSGEWSADMFHFLKLLPINGYNSESDNTVASEVIPTIYDMVTPNATGAHAVVLSPSNASLLAKLREFNIFNRTYRSLYGVRYTYKLVGNRYLLAVPEQGLGSFAYLFKRTGSLWFAVAMFYSRDVEETVNHAPLMLSQNIPVSLPKDRMDLDLVPADSTDTMFFIMGSISKGLFKDRLPSSVDIAMYYPATGLLQNIIIGGN